MMLNLTHKRKRFHFLFPILWKRFKKEREYEETF